MVEAVFQYGLLHSKSWCWTIECRNFDSKGLRVNDSNASGWALYGLEEGTPDGSGFKLIFEHYWGSDYDTNQWLADSDSFAYNTWHHVVLTSHTATLLI